MLPELKSKSTTAQRQPSKTENICLSCNKTFSKLKSLERHKTMHEKNKTTETTYECTVCGAYQSRYFLIIK